MLLGDPAECEGDRALKLPVSGSLQSCRGLACRYVVCLLSDARRERSSLVILDAQNLEEGPLCQLHLRKLLPMAFHCAWSSAVHM